MKKTVLLWRARSEPRYRSSIARSVRPSFTLKTMQAILASDPRIQVDLFDSKSSLSHGTVEDWLAEREPGVVIIESALHGLPEIAAAASMLGKHALVIFIGQGPTAVPEQFLDVVSRHPAVYLVGGEPEEVVARALAEYMSSGGLTFLRQNSYHRESRRVTRHLFEGFSSSPTIRFSRHELDSYVYRFPLKTDRKLVWGHVMATRGCPHACTFCTHLIRESYGHRLRTKSLDALREEMAHLKELGVNAIAFADDDLTADRNFLVSLCDMMIDAGFAFRWTAHARVDECDEELLGQMRRAGCSLLRFGVEAGSARVLRYYNKSRAPELWWGQTQRTIEACRRLDIQTSGLFILGAPTEGVIDLVSTAKHAVSTGFDLLQLHFYTPYPDTAESRRIGSETTINYNHYSLNCRNHSAAPAWILKTVYLLLYFSFYLNPLQVIRMVRTYGGFIRFNFRHFAALKLGLFGISAEVVSSRRRS